MKPPRLQFSLRMLLMLMAAVGASLAIYRWPWQESKFSRRSFGTELNTTEDIEYELRTTYHRDWRCQKVKHGVEQSFRNGELWHEAHYYDGELSGRRRVWNFTGQLAIEGTYLGGQLHGPYRSGNGLQWTSVGQFSRDKLAGEWRASGDFDNYWRPLSFEYFVAGDGTPKDPFSDPLPDLPITTISHWLDGKRHGPTTWLAHDGQVLNTAEYVDDELVSWNGQPVVEQFWNWLRASADPQLLAQLSSATEDWRPRNPRGNELVLFLEVHSSVKFQRLQIHVEGERRFGYPRHLTPLVPALCEYALLEGYGFDYRYGGLWLVPREGDPSPPFVDPTGVAQVKFPAGSQQEREWLEPIEVLSQEGTVTTCLNHLLGETSIASDFTAIGGTVFRQQTVDNKVLFTRRRCDIVGFVLYRAGYRCEQQGNTLRILPRWQERPADPYRGPLWLPEGF